MIYLGFEFSPVEGWQGILPAPKAPSNWKDPAKIAAYTAQKLEELRNGKAATDPLSGRVARVVVFEVNGKAPALDARDTGVANAFKNWLDDRSEQPEGGHIKPPMAGFNIRLAMRLIALDLIGVYGHVPDNFCWALELDPYYRYNEHYFDPLSALFGSSSTDLVGACRRLDIGEPGPTDALQLALIARRMGKLMW